MAACMPGLGNRQLSNLASICGPTQTPWSTAAARTWFEVYVDSGRQCTVTHQVAPALVPSAAAPEAARREAQQHLPTSTAATTGTCGQCGCGSIQHVLAAQLLHLEFARRAAGAQLAALVVHHPKAHHRLPLQRRRAFWERLVRVQHSAQGRHHQAGVLVPVAPALIGET